MSVNVTQFILYGCYLDPNEIEMLSEDTRDELNINTGKIEGKPLNWFPDCYSDKWDILAKVIYQGPHDEQGGADDGIFIEMSDADKYQVHSKIEEYIGMKGDRKYGFIFINYYT